MLFRSFTLLLLLVSINLHAQTDKLDRSPIEGIKVGTYCFNYGSCDILPKAQKDLDSLIVRMKRNPVPYTHAMIEFRAFYHKKEALDDYFIGVKRTKRITDYLIKAFVDFDSDIDSRFIMTETVLRDDTPMEFPCDDSFVLIYLIMY